MTVTGLGDHAADLSCGGGSVTGAADRHRRQGVRHPRLPTSGKPAGPERLGDARRFRRGGDRVTRGTTVSQAVGVGEQAVADHQRIATAAGLLDVGGGPTLGGRHEFGVTLAGHDAERHRPRAS